MRIGDLVVQLEDAEYLGSWKMRTGGRLRSTTPVRGIAGELEDETWRLCSRTLVRGVARDDPQECPTRVSVKTACPFREA